MVRRAEGGQRSIIQNRGRAVAAIVSIEDLSLIERIEDEVDLAEVRRRRREESIPWDVIRERLGL
jgi:antitoxin (DNA-binding transcriptional repressor) of toxin-antitoxin stability system